MSNWPFLLKCICLTDRIGLIFRILLLQFAVSGPHVQFESIFVPHFNSHFFFKGFQIIGRANVEREKHGGLPFVPYQKRFDP